MFPQLMYDTWDDDNNKTNRVFKNDHVLQKVYGGVER